MKTWIRMPVLIFSLWSVATLAVFFGGQVFGYKSQIAYEVYNEGDWDIYLMDVTRGFAHNITPHSAWDHEPVWSPDGSRIAYTALQDGDSDIHLIQIMCPSPIQPCDTPRNLTQHAGHEHDPVWSPDGTRIAFVSDRDHNPEIYVMDQNGDNLHNLSTNPVIDDTPIWSPDGAQIVFRSDREDSQRLYTVDASGGSVRQITQGFSRDVVFSPDGGRVAFTSGGDVFIAPTDCLTLENCSAAAYNLTRSPYRDWSPSWSPDGAEILFQSNRSTKPEVYVLDSDCADLACAAQAWRLTAGLDSALLPSWSPDGAQIVMMSNDTGHIELYLLDRATTTIRRLTYLNGHLFGAAWKT
jgi:Tol biopolymer transport system component